MSFGDSGLLLLVRFASLSTILIARSPVGANFELVPRAHISRQLNTTLKVFRVILLHLLATNFIGAHA